MQIKHFNLNLTDDDMMTLSIGLEMYIKEEIKNYKGKTDMYEDSLHLLHQFINLGYTPHISTDGTPWKCKTYTDAWEWAKAICQKNK